MVEFWQVSQETHRNLTRLLENRELLEPHPSVGKKNEGLSYYLREYEALGEEFHVAMTLNDFCTIKSEVVDDMDASSHEGSLMMQPPPSLLWATRPPGQGSLTPSQIGSLRP
jgi:hypothetical protein